MKIFFDTEFLEDGQTIELISIGLVRGDGATYYAETMIGADLATRDPWLTENVLPNLRHGDAIKDRSQIAAELLTFVGEKPEFWAYYADYDWVALCQLYGRMIDLPKDWPKFCRDIKQRAVDLGNPKLPEQGGAEHDALADALWNKQAYEFLLTSAARLP